MIFNYRILSEECSLLQSFLCEQGLKARSHIETELNYPVLRP